MEEYNKNLQELQHIIKKSIYGNANIVSNKNSMFDKCLENIKREFYHNDREAFYKYMEDFFYPIVYNIENINLDKIYLEFIKSTIILNIFEFESDEYKDFPLTISEYSDLFNIHITEEDCSNYHSSHINYKLECHLMTPELLETINKYFECDVNISIYNGSISLIPKNGYSVINYILDKNNDISSNITKTLEMFRKLYIKLKEVNEFINNKILN